MPSRLCGCSIQSFIKTQIKHNKKEKTSNFQSDARECCKAPFEQFAFVRFKIGSLPTKLEGLAGIKTKSAKRQHRF